MTEEEAYAAMFIYLDEIWKIHKWEPLAIILGDLALLEDGSSADPVAMQDWKAAVARARAGEKAGNLGIS